MTLPPSMSVHLQQCAACRELVLILTTDDPFPEPSPALLGILEDRILSDLKPVTPLRPARDYIAALAITFLVLVAIGAWLLNASALGAMSPLLRGVVLSALGVSTAFLISSLVRQMAPGSPHHVRPDVLPLCVLVLLGSLFTVLFPHRVEVDFWRTGWICLRCGLAFFAPAAIVFWFLFRRGAILSARVAGATIGVLAGLTGTTVLEIHCPLQSAWHIVTWHLGVSIVGALACLALAFLSERRTVHLDEGAH